MLRGFRGGRVAGLACGSDPRKACCDTFAKRTSWHCEKENIIALLTEIMEKVGIIHTEIIKVVA
jgi:hypothetical protein